MAVYVPSYLYLSKHHIWYFRWPVPRHYSPAGRAKHIRLSLGTRDPKQALRLSKQLEYHAIGIQGHLAATGMDYILIRKALKDYFAQWLAKEKAAIRAFPRRPAASRPVRMISSRYCLSSGVRSMMYFFLAPRPLVAMCLSLVASFAIKVNHTIL